MLRSSESLLPIKLKSAGISWVVRKCDTQIPCIQLVSGDTSEIHISYQTNPATGTFPCHFPAFFLGISPPPFPVGPPAVLNVIKSGCSRWLGISYGSGATKRWQMSTSFQVWKDDFFTLKGIETSWNVCEFTYLNKNHPHLIQKKYIEAPNFLLIFIENHPNMMFSHIHRVPCCFDPKDDQRTPPFASKIAKALWPSRSVAKSFSWVLKVTSDGVRPDWLVVFRHPSEKWWRSSIGMMISIPILMGKCPKNDVPNHQPVYEISWIYWNETD